MNHKKGFNPLSKPTPHRRAMLRNMVTSLLRHGRITTTRSKALEASRKAERLITRAKVDSVHNRRQVARYLYDESVLDKLFKCIAPRMKDRNGGYTRIMRLGFRQGDAADMAILELVDYDLEAVEERKRERKERKAAKKPAAAKSAAKPAKAAAAK